MKARYKAIALLVFIMPVYCSAQQAPSLPKAETTTPVQSSAGEIKKGSFYITPYYQYSLFQKLRLVSNTNEYSQIEGESSYEFTSGEIAEYNDQYNTDFTNSLMGIKIGYVAIKGLGVNAFIGVSHFHFRNFISDENTQSISTKYPALTFGGVVDYEKTVAKNLMVMGFASVTYTTTNTVLTDNNSGEEVISSSLDALAWDVDAALSYQLGKFLPYAGVGFTQQYINTVSTEQIRVTDDDGNELYNTTTFDSGYRGDALYGFAGLEYLISPYVSVYARGTFVNPVRLTAGIRVII